MCICIYKIIYINIYTNTHTVDMLRKRKWIHLICSIKTTNGRESIEEKIGIKSRATNRKQ